MPVTQPPVAATLAGNTAGALALVSSGTLTLAGGNNVTLSQAGNAVTISAGAGGGGAGYTAGLSNVGNTAGDTGAVTARLILAGGNNVTLSGSTNGGSITVTVSAANSGTAPPIGTSVEAVATAGSTGTITRFAPEDHRHAGVNLAGVSNVGNTSGNTTVQAGRLVLAGGNNVTLSVGTAANGLQTVTVSAANSGTAPPIATAVKLDVSTVGSTGTITRFAPEDHQHRGVNSVGVSNVGNTAGTSGANPGRLVLAGGNQITLSQSTDATGSTITVSAAETQTVPPIATAVKVDVSTVASTGTLTRFAPEDHQHRGVNSVGVSTAGNTLGDTGAGPGRMVLAGGNNITLSQATDGTGSTVTISGDQPTLSYFENSRQVATNTINNLSPVLLLTPLHPGDPVFPGRMTASTVRLQFSGTVSTAAGFTVSLSLGIYTLSNATRLDLLNSVSTSWGTGGADANVNVSFAGYRFVTFHSSQWSSQPVFTGGRYWLGLHQRSSSGSRTFVLLGAQNYVPPNATRSGLMGAGSNTNTTLGWAPFLGQYSVTFSTAMPASLHASDIDKANASVGFIPGVVFDNVHSIP